MNSMTALTIWVLDMRAVTMFGPLLACDVPPLFWIYMSPKLWTIVAELVGRN